MSNRGWRPLPLALMRRDCGQILCLIYGCTPRGTPLRQFVRCHRSCLPWCDAWLFISACVSTVQKAGRDIEWLRKSIQAAELRADADVMQSLRKNGDIPSIVRPVDVRFVGEAADIARLADAIRSVGWKVVQVVTLNDCQHALDIQRHQTTEPSAMRALTVEALNFVQTYNVRYDGWGAVAVTKQS